MSGKRIKRNDSERDRVAKNGHSPKKPIAFPRFVEKKQMPANTDTERFIVSRAEIEQGLRNGMKPLIESTQKLMGATERLLAGFQRYQEAFTNLETTWDQLEQIADDIGIDEIVRNSLPERQLFQWDKFRCLLLELEEIRLGISKTTDGFQPAEYV